MTPKLSRSLAILTITVSALLVAACDDASPVAPEGTVLSMSANPDRISATGESQIRVIARKPNGNPVNPGTQVRFSTSLGDIPSVVPTDSQGEAATTLRGTGVQGTATVRASAGSTEEVTVDVQIGLNAGSIVVQATPAAVSEEGGEVDLLAIVRDDMGQALQGSSVNFRTDIGTLGSGGRLLTTDSEGTVTDTLAVESADTESVNGDSFQVTAEVGGGSGLLSGTATISVQRLPKASFTFVTNNLTVVFTDTSTGNPVDWRWEFGDGNTSNEQNPSNSYSAAGTYTVKLTAFNSQGSSSSSKIVSVSGQ